MTATSTVAIQAQGQAKAYGATRALSGVDLEVRAGTVLGLLGPNGQDRHRAHPGHAAAPERRPRPGRRLAA